MERIPITWLVTGTRRNFSDIRDPVGQTDPTTPPVVQQLHTRTACARSSLGVVRVEGDHTDSCNGSSIINSAASKGSSRPGFGANGKQEDLAQRMRRNLSARIASPSNQTKSNPSGRMLQHDNDIAGPASNEAARLFEGNSVPHILFPFI